MNAKKIREFINDLFRSNLVTRLEYDILHQQSQYEDRIREKDEEIGRLRTQIVALNNKIDDYMSDPSFVWWLTQRNQAPRTHTPQQIPSVDTPRASTWQEIQADWYRKQEESNGVPVERRSEELQQQV